MTDIDVDIFIKNNETGQYLRIPVIPETIDYTDGDTQVNSVNILQLGAVDFPNGVDLDSTGWSSFFPATYDPSYCKYSELEKPLDYRNHISSWKDAGTSLQLIIPAAGINKNMYVKSFNWSLKGAEGDLYYNIGFKELKILRPIQINTDAATVSKEANKTPAARPAVPTTQASKTYTVKSGDTLSRIAKSLGLGDWNKLYEANKSVIGANPNAIEPGQVYKIP